MYGHHYEPGRHSGKYVTCSLSIMISAWASVKLGELLGYLDRFEPTNHQLYHDVYQTGKLVVWSLINGCSN